jgi:hypothetical protein
MGTGGRAGVATDDLTSAERQEHQLTRRHNAGVEGSSPSLSTDRISVLATDAESARSP